MVVTLSFLEGVGLIRAENSPPSRPAIKVNVTIIISSTSSTVRFFLSLTFVIFPRLYGAYSCQLLGTLSTEKYELFTFEKYSLLTRSHYFNKYIPIHPRGAGFYGS